MNIEELRQNGFKVRVKHVRHFPNNGAVVESGESFELDQYLTKGEYLRAKEEFNLEFTEEAENNPKFDYMNAYDIPYGKAVSPTGGFTLVEICTYDDKLIASGKRNFGRKEAFNKKTGLHGAFNQAMNRFEKVQETLQVS